MLSVRPDCGKSRAPAHRPPFRRKPEPGTTYIFRVPASAGMTNRGRSPLLGQTPPLPGLGGALLARAAQAVVEPEPERRCEEIVRGADRVGVEKAPGARRKAGKHRNWEQTLIVWHRRDYRAADLTES